MCYGGPKLLYMRSVLLQPKLNKLILQFIHILNKFIAKELCSNCVDTHHTQSNKILSLGFIRKKVPSFIMF